METRLRIDEAYRAALRARAKKRSLRPSQDLDPLHVEDIRERIARTVADGSDLNRGVVYVDARRCIARGDLPSRVGNSSNCNIGLDPQQLREIHARCHTCEVLRGSNPSCIE